MPTNRAFSWCLVRIPRCNLWVHSYIYVKLEESTITQLYIYTLPKLCKLWMRVSWFVFPSAYFCFPSDGHIFGMVTFLQPYPPGSPPRGIESYWDGRGSVVTFLQPYPPGPPPRGIESYWDGRGSVVTFLQPYPQAHPLGGLNPTEMVGDLW
jgi:hypothetical protein